MDQLTKIEQSEHEVAYVDWKIAPEVSQELRSGAETLINKIRAFNPDIVVVLKRSGSLAYSGVDKLAEEKSAPLPPSTQIHIGREISDPFLEEDEDFQAFGESDWKRYDEYLTKQAEDSNSLVSKAIVELKSKIESSRVKRVFIVDDSSFGGVTLGHTAPFIIKEAFGKDTFVGSGLVFEHNNGWLTRIIRDTFNPDELAKGPGSGDVLNILSVLVKGEYEKGDWGLDTSGKIKDWGIVKMVGQAIVDNPVIGEPGRQNPAEILEKKYRKETLLSLHNSFIEALQKEVS